MVNVFLGIVHAGFAHDFATDFGVGSVSADNEIVLDRDFVTVFATVDYLLFEVVRRISREYCRIKKTSKHTVEKSISFRQDYIREGYNQSII